MEKNDSLSSSMHYYTETTPQIEEYVICTIGTYDKISGFNVTLCEYGDTPAKLPVHLISSKKLRKNHKTILPHGTNHVFVVSLIEEEQSGDYIEVSLIDASDQSEKARVLSHREKCDRLMSRLKNIGVDVDESYRKFCITKRTDPHPIDIISELEKLRSPLGESIPEPERGLFIENFHRIFGSSTKTLSKNLELRSLHIDGQRIINDALAQVLREVDSAKIIPVSIPVYEFRVQSESDAENTVKMDKIITILSPLIYHQ
jgi:translation initiation factor 2 alpha subunit (eIF-2alpha)